MALNKLKIGILSRDFVKPENWENRIFKGIIEHPDLELSLLIRDRRRQLYSGINPLLTLQTNLESFLFKKNIIVNTAEIINKLNSTETINFNSEEDFERVKAYNLDLIVQLTSNGISDDISQVAQHGIWSIRHTDGFWDIVNNEPFCRVSLFKGENIIDEAFYNWSFSYYKTRSDLLEGSVSLLFKNIQKILRDIKIQPANVYNCKPGKVISLRYTIIYAFRFYLKIWNHIINRLFSLKRLNCWALFFGKGIFFDSNPAKLSPAPLPKKVFWADPFLYEHENVPYVFFEKYIYKIRKGIISTGKVVEKEPGKYSVVEVQDILDFNYHLSYPHIVKENGHLYMIPETHQNKRLEIYSCVHFPEKWELYATAFDGEEIVDTTYFQDEKGDRWLFLNKGWSYNSELHIYKIDSLKLNSLIPHRSNPVIIDCRKGRSGGGIYKYKNEYYRPSQINTHGSYGKGLHISKIKILTLDEFEDEPITSIMPDFMEGLVGMHHLHHSENYFVFDACYKTLP